MVDPLAELHYEHTPYNYVLGNPMTYADLMGLDTIKYSNGGILPEVTGGDVLVNENGASSTVLPEVSVGGKSSYSLIGPDIEPVEGIWGNVSYTLFGREHNGYSYNRDGKSVIKPIELTAPDIGIKGGIKGLLSVAKGVKKALPSLDATGKVHGTLPKVQDLGKYSKEELQILLKELRQSVQKKIEVTSKMGRDRGHGQRQGAKQDLIKSLEKYLGK